MTSDRVVVQDEDRMAYLLGVYCAYLNNWNEGDMGNDHVYTPADFGLTAVYVTSVSEDVIGFKEVEANQYGSAEVIAELDLRVDEEYVIWVVRVGDGDEGGPAEITAWWEEETEWVWDDLVHHQGHSVHRGWSLKDAIQTFDTYRNFIIREGITQGP